MGIAARLPLAERRVVVRIAMAALAFRVASAVIALFVNRVFPLNQREQFTVFGTTSVFWDTFARYDSGWFYQIAKSGYAFAPGGPSAGIGKPGKIAFFPVYPFVMRYVGRLFGSDPSDLYLAGIVVSWVAFAAAMVALYFLARLDVPRRQAERAVLLAAVFPFSFFFGLVYSESLFLLMSILSFYAFRTRHWLLGGMAGAVATATRVNGILMLPALAWIAWRTVKPTLQDRLTASIGLLLLTAGIGGYSLYVYYLAGHPFEWINTIRLWGYDPGGRPWKAPIQLVQRLLTDPHEYFMRDPMAPYDLLYGVTAIAFLVLTPLVWKKLGAAYGLLMLLNLWLPLSSGVFEGLGRYCSVLFPAFIMLASIRSRAIGTGLVVVFALFYTLALALFTTIHPIF